MGYMMIIKEESKEIFQALKDCINELKPEIEVKLLKEDINLFNLGFRSFIPCDIEIIATDNQIDELMDMIIQFEVNAYDTPNGIEPKETDENYIKYQKYGWIYGLLSQIK